MEFYNIGARCLLLTLSEAKKDFLFSTGKIIWINLSVWIFGAALPMNAFMGVGKQ